MERVGQDVAEFLKKVQQGKHQEVKEAIESDKTLAGKEDASGRIGLHFAAYSGELHTTQVLVEGGSAIDATDFDGNTPLNLAVKKGNKQIIDYLVASGANVNLATSRGATPLHHAAAAGNVEVIEQLIALGAVISQDATEVGSALHWSAHSGEIAPVAYFLDVLNIPIELVDANQGTVLHTAAAFGFADLVLFLLERGANPNKAARGGSTPLHVSVETVTNKEVIRHLIVFGAVDCPDADGLTAEATAEKQGKADVFKEGVKTAGSHKISGQAKLEKMEQFKQQGNKVFQAGEYSKGSKFYTLAISFQPTNHVLFSNRSACYYNLKQYHRALADACHCVNLKPDWPKGYFRKAASLVSLGKFEQAKKIFEAGLQIDPKNADLVSGLKDLLKKAPQVA